MDGIPKQNSETNWITQENTEVFLLTSAKKHEIKPGSQHLLKEYLDLLSNDLDMGNYAPRLEVKT